jgi:hypothetical protein
MPPKGHHFIPRLHLEHFAGNDPQGQVWTYDAQTGRVWSAIPEETAVQTHFYSAENPDGTMNTSLEEALSKVEGAAAPTYERLLQGVIPEVSQERMDFAYFIGLMYVRTPAMRRMVAEIYGRGIQIHNYAYATHPEAFETLMHEFESETGYKLDPAAKEDIKKGMIDPSGRTLMLPQEQTFTVLKSAEKLAGLFFKMNWFTMRADQGFFITSDNPVVREVDPKSRSPFYGDGGFANNTVEVTFPLSREVLFLMAWNPAPRKKSLSREAVDRANWSRSAHSDRYLYAHIQHAYVQKLAARFKDSRPNMTTHGFGPDKFAPITISRRSKKRPKK